jgi:ribulose-phosphate 3-epimerase|uniref:Ribulose-phosphate 3-epimerase n=1 Tax=Desulfobacca acetoxidans TaxID=60893 RepID=A0A7C3Z748_9BACT
MTPAKKIISASILSADFGRLAEQIHEAEAAGVDWIHVDVMDGHFVPNLTIGLPVLAAVRKITKLPLDVHLMISNPHLYIKEYIDAGADWLGVQVEAAWHLERLVQEIKELGARATVVLNPATSLSTLDVILSEVDMVLLMTVNPGYSGQKFIPATLPKIKQLRAKIDSQGLDVLLQVDGGVHLDTIEALVAAGVDVVVSGSGIFTGNDIAGNVRRLRERLG